jgi:hypothetical protein
MRAPLSITRLNADCWYRRPLGCHYGWYNTERTQAGWAGAHRMSMSPPGMPSRPSWTINPQHPPAPLNRHPPGRQHSGLAGEPEEPLIRSFKGVVLLVRPG